jgi:tyrosinase
MALRKNQNSLSATEKKRFTDALIALKDGGSAGNLYDGFVKTHDDNVPYGHFGPAFFAWHRQFLIEFEQALQTVMNDQSIALPYWEWWANQSQDSLWPFTNDFLGGNGQQGSDWQVMDGPFAYRTGNWPLNVRSGSEPNPYLRRQLGVSRYAHTLPTWANVWAALQATPYDVSPWNTISASGFRNRAEGFYPGGPTQMHNRVHEWVGGSMMTMTSPNDPVFWLHHCYMDKLWTDWTVMHQDQAQYLPDGGAAPGHNLTDPMPPWSVRPADVLKTWDHGYHYDTDRLLLAGETLYPSQSIYSSGVAPRLYLEYRTDGILVLQSSNFSLPSWKSTDSAKPVGKCTMESQGNLVIYGPDNRTVVWQSGTASSESPCYLAVRPDGHVAIYPPRSSTPIWTKP